MLHGKHDCMSVPSCRLRNQVQDSFLEGLLCLFSFLHPPLSGGLQMSRWKSFKHFSQSKTRTSMGARRPASARPAAGQFNTDRASDPQATINLSRPSSGKSVRGASAASSKMSKTLPTRPKTAFTTTTNISERQPRVFYSRPQSAAASRSAAEPSTTRTKKVRALFELQSVSELLPFRRSGPRRPTLNSPQRSASNHRPYCSTTLLVSPKRGSRRRSQMT